MNLHECIYACVNIINYNITLETVPDGAPVNPSGSVIDSQTLSLTWEEPLEEHHNGIIREYHINIIEVDTGRQIRVVSTTTSVSVPSLHPYYTYQWTVSAFTIGEGPFSAPQNISTPEDGRILLYCFVMMLTPFFVCTVPSGAPQMLTVVATGVTNISLSWQQPSQEEINGVILGYSVRISRVSSTETREITTVYTNLTVTSLTPYTLYECLVSAYTAIGTGPSSAIILARTESTSKPAVHIL